MCTKCPEVWTSEDIGQLIIVGNISKFEYLIFVGCVCVCVCVCLCLCWFLWFTRTFDLNTHQHYRDIWVYEDRGHVLIIPTV